jgi:heme-degrading monooxygenase HmoA
MYAMIRRYGVKDQSAFDDIQGLRQRIERGMLPRLQEIPGFHCYYVVAGDDDREVVTISIFENQDGARESTRRAADFVRDDPMRDQLGTPEITEGELLVSREAAVGAH